MRSGYSDDCDGWALIMWRGAVNSAIKGKRGQAFLHEMKAAMDAMPNKRLISGELIEGGDVCAIGSVIAARGIDAELHPYDSEGIAKHVGISNALVKEIASINDDDFGYQLETPEERYARVYRWVKEQLIPAHPTPSDPK